MLILTASPALRPSFHAALEKHFRLTMPVCPTPTFYRWLFGWGWDGSIIVEGPDEVVRQYKKMLRKALRKNPCIHPTAL